MATSIEDRVRQLGDTLGPRLGADEQLTPRIRLAPFYNALIIEVDGEAWVLSEATVAPRFLQEPSPVAPRDTSPGSTRDTSLEIRNTLGQDLGPLFLEAAATAGISVQLLIACAIAESGLNPYAERWGRETTAARAAIQAGDHEALQAILDRVWPDVSFGYSQRIVLYHDLGDRSRTVANVLAVRDQVFAHPDHELARMATLLASHQANARSADLSRVDGDVELAALVSYNAGHLPPPASSYWSVYAGNVASYRAAFARARELAP